MHSASRAERQACAWVYTPEGAGKRLIREAKPLGLTEIPPYLADSKDAFR